ATRLVQISLPWQFAGLGTFYGTDTSDMLLRNAATGALELYDISNNAASDPVSMGQVGLEWQVAGFGDFSGNANETDMLMRKTSTGQFELYDIRNNQIASATPMGQVGLSWQVDGIASSGTGSNTPPAQLVQAMAAFSPSSSLPSSAMTSNVVDNQLSPSNTLIATPPSA